MTLSRPRAISLLALLVGAAACGGGGKRGPSPAGPQGGTVGGRGPAPAGDALVAETPDAAAAPPAVVDAAADDAAGAASDAGADSAAVTGTWVACGQLGIGRPREIALSADGSTVALAYSGGPVAIHRTADFALVRLLPFERQAIWGVTLSADGGLVAFNSPSSGPRVERSVDGQVMFQPGPGASFKAFSPDGQQVLLLGGAIDEGRAQLWSLATGKLLRDFPGAEASDAAFTQGGKAVVVLGHQQITTFPQDGPPSVAKLPFSSGLISPRGDVVVGVPDDSLYSTPAAYRIADGRRLWTAKREIGALSFVFSADQKLLVGHDREGVWQFDPATGAARALTLVEPAIWALAMPRADAPVILSDRAGLRLVTLDDLERGQPFPSRVPGQSPPVMALAISRDGKRLATAAFASGENVTVWDVPSAKVIRTIHSPVPTAGVSFSPDGRTLLRSGMGVEEYDLERGDSPPRTGAATGLTPSGIWVAKYSPDGQRIAFTHDRDLHIVDRATLAQIALIPTTSSSPSFAFSPDGRSIAVSGPELYTVDGVRVWPATPPPASNGSGLVDNWLAFSADGTLVVESRLAAGREPPPYLRIAGNAFARNSVFDASTGAARPNINLPYPRRPEFSPDGGFLLAGNRLWSLPQGRITRLPERGRVLVSTFTPDGRIAAALEGGEVVLYCPR